MEYIVTYTGQHFTPLKPDENNILIEDIAHSLSMMCRANGHIDTFYSVAQHSINCANEAKARGYQARIQMACLLHDGSEAYISDITRPVKFYLAEYKAIEERLQNAIYRKFIGSTLSSEEQAIVKQIDDNMLVNEHKILMNGRIKFDEIPKLYIKPVLECIGYSETESTFLKTYYGIMHAGIVQGR